MFPTRYFSAKYWAARFWAKVGSGDAPPDLNLHTTTTLGLISDRSTRGLTTTYTTRALGSDRSTEAI